LTGRKGRPENPSSGGRFPTLCQLSYAPNRGDGTRTRNFWSKKEPPPSQQADCGTLKERTTAEASNGCEARLRTRTSCFRGRRGTSSTTSHCSRVWTERFELPSPGSRS